MTLPKKTENEDRLSIDEAYSLALSHQQNQSFEIAEKLYRLILDAQPGYSSARASLAQLLYSVNRLEEALKLARQVAEQRPDIPEFHVIFGLCLKRDKQYGAACEEFRQALSLDPAQTLAEYGLAEALKHLDRFDEAVAIYRRLMQASPESNVDFKDFLEAPFHHHPFPLEYILLTVQGGPFDRTELRLAWETLLQEDSLSPIALKQFSHQVADMQLDSVACAILALMWRTLFEAGWYNDPDQANAHPFKPDHLLQMCRETKPVNLALKALGASPFRGGARYLDDGLRFSLSSSPDWNSIVFHHLIIPVIAVLKEEELSLAYSLDLAIRFSFAQQPLLEEQSEYCSKLVRPIFRSMGITLANRAHLKQNNRRPSGYNIPRVAFVFDFVLDFSSPAIVLYNFLKGCRQISGTGKGVWPVIYCFNDYLSEVKEMMRTFGFDLFSMTAQRKTLLSEDDDLSERLLDMAQHIRNNQIDAVVYIATDSFLNLAASFRILPVQIFWSMGFTYQQAPHISAYIYNGTFEQFSTVNRQTWRIGRAGLNWYHPELKEQGSVFRHENSVSEVVLGHLGRTQKIANEAFLHALGEILASRPQAGFLWTGSESIPQIDESLYLSGVSGRCKHVGAVKGRMFVHAIDILLDPWPFGGGHSVHEAMAAGVPVVFYRYDYMKEPGALRSILLAFDGVAGTAAEQADVRRIFTGKGGQNLLLVADTPSQYTLMVQQLIDDPVFRSEVGEAGRQFTEKYLSDVNQMALSYSTHIIEAIDGYWSANV